MLLHAIYNNGRVIFKEKDLPQIKTEILIEIPVADFSQNKPANYKTHILRDLWEDRNDMGDSVDYVNSQRKNWRSRTNDND